MKKQIVLSSTVEEIRKDLSEDELFEIFKKKVDLLYKGENFFCSRSNDCFTAKTIDVDVVIDLDQPIQAFVKEKYTFERGGTGLGVRSYNSILVFLGVNQKNESFSIKEFLNYPKDEFLKTRNTGKASYDFMINKFRELGIPTEGYPLFS